MTTFRVGDLVQVQLGDEEQPDGTYTPSWFEGRVVEEMNAGGTTRVQVLCSAIPRWCGVMPFERHEMRLIEQQE